MKVVAIVGDGDGDGRMAVAALLAGAAAVVSREGLHARDLVNVVQAVAANGVAICTVTPSDVVRDYLRDHLIGFNRAGWGGSLSDDERRAVLAVVEHDVRADAARSVGVSIRTLSRLLDSAKKKTGTHSVMQLVFPAGSWGPVADG